MNTGTNTVAADPSAAIAAARDLVQQGQIERAEQAYARILDGAPDNVEALNFLAIRALNRRDLARGIALLEQARRAAAEDPATLENLGVAYRVANRPEAAVEALQVGLRADPKAYVTCLHLAVTLEQLGRGHDALVAYFRALSTAQNCGVWRSEATTPPVLRPLVRHAMTTVDQGRRRLFSAVLAPLRERHGAAVLLRVERCLAGYLGELPLDSPDPRQQPKFLYFPDLPTRAYLDRALFPWLDRIERETAAIRAELQSMLAARRGFVPFLDNRTAAEVEGYLASTDAAKAPVWDAYFFYRHGQRYDDNCANCPRSAALIDSVPDLCRIGDHSPEVCFSMLTPGTHILPHRGVTNTRLVTHLPLIVPPDCALNVSGEIHEWKEGRCIVFDDTFEHEAWNRSDRLRVVLLMDVWNPHLTPVEREAVKYLIEAIGLFNRQAEVETPTD